MNFTCKQEGRIDVLMSKEIGKPRAQIEKFIKNIGVKVNGKIVKKPGFKVKKGDEIEYEPVANEPSDPEYNVDFDIEILYEDNHMLVINKPPFIVVHQAPSVKEATVVDWLKKKGLRLSTISGEERHGIVHRIDKETSGALAIAKSDEAHIALAKQLEDKTMGRYYLAIIDLPLKENRIVNQPIARNPKNRLKMAVVEGGRDAKSAFVKLAISDDGKRELIAVKLFSGRTHQIRVHLNHLSRHILGDGLYGFKSRNGKIKRVMLHAYLLYLKHPVSNEDLKIKAPLFDDFKSLLELYFKKEDIYEILTPDNIINSFDSIC